MRRNHFGILNLLEWNCYPGPEKFYCLLPAKESYTGSDIGRASKGSAVGLLAKVYLTLGSYADVVSLCQQVTSLGYSLNANYADNFDPAHKNGPESLFEVQYSGSTTYGFFDDYLKHVVVKLLASPCRYCIRSAGKNIYHSR